MRKVKSKFVVQTRGKKLKKRKKKKRNTPISEVKQITTKVQRAVEGVLYSQRGVS